MISSDINKPIKKVVSSVDFKLFQTEYVDVYY